MRPPDAGRGRRHAASGTRASWRGFGLALAVVAVGTSAAGAQMFVPAGRDTLRGLPGIEVVVEDPQPELARAGLTAAAIREDVTRRLEAAGVTVYPSQRDNPSPAQPYLYVHLNALALPGDAAYAVAIQVHLRQTLRSLVTDSNVVNAMSWETHNVLAVSADALAAVRGEVLDYVDRFIDDWKATRQP